MTFDTFRVKNGKLVGEDLHFAPLNSGSRIHIPGHAQGIGKWY